jgi:predicted MFS family arabinose efflux permease
MKTLAVCRTDIERLPSAGCEPAVFGTATEERSSLVTRAGGVISQARIIILVAWGAAGFGLGPIVQHQATRAAGVDANVVNSLNISAINLGIAIGALIGGRIVAVTGVHAVPLVGAAIVLCSTALGASTAHRARPATHARAVVAEAAA